MAVSPALDHNDDMAKDSGATVASFLAASVPSEVGRAVRQGARGGNGFCYRHDPKVGHASPGFRDHSADDLKNNHCRAQTANELLIGDIQKSLEGLPEGDKEGISHIWSFFSAANPVQRQLILQGLLAQCCFPQLSFVASCTRDLIRIDYVSALPTEIGFKILAHLDASSLCKAAQVSKRWAELANDDVVWHRMCEQHIDRKCTKCGWGLPLLERKRLRASRQKIQERAAQLANQYDDASARILPLTSAEAVFDSNVDSKDQNKPRKRTSDTTEDPEDNRPAKRHMTISDCNPILGSTRPWKDVYCERQKIESNWRKGRYTSHVLKGHTDGVMCVQADESMIASGSYDTTVKIWDLATGEQLRSLDGHTRGVNAVQFDDTKLISASMDKTLKIWNYRTGECISTLRGHTEGVLSLHFDETILASGGADQTIRVWNFKDGTCSILRGHTGWINAVKVHSACQVVFSASDDTTMKMWSLKDQTCLRTFSGHVGQVQAICPALLPVSEQDSSTMEQPTCPEEYFTSSLDGTIKWWDVKTGSCIKTLFGHVEGIWGLAADTLRVVSGAQDRTVKVWDRNDGRCVLSLAGHSGPVNAIQLGDSKIISGGDDGQIRIWDFSPVSPTLKAVPGCTDSSHDHHPSNLRLQQLSQVNEACS